MNRSFALLLQLALVVLGLAVAAFLLWEPHLEGRNVHATTFEIYFKDPFLAYVYVGSLPFFMALYRAYKLLGHVRIMGAFSRVTVEALCSIKRCAFVLMGFVAGGVVIILVFGDKEDRPAGVFMSFLVTLGASAIAVTAAAFARNVRRTLPPSGAGRD